MPDDRTSIWVSDELWRELHTRKDRGDSFEDVIWRVLDDEGEQTDGEPSEEPAPEPEAEPTPEPAGDDELERAGWALERAEDATLTDENAEAVARVLAYAREHGSVTAREALEHVMLNGYDADYETEDVEKYLAGEKERYRGGWWRSMVKPALKELPEIEAPPSGGSEWEYVG